MSASNNWISEKAALIERFMKLKKDYQELYFKFHELKDEKIKSELLELK